MQLHAGFRRLSATLLPNEALTDPKRKKRLSGAAPAVLPRTSMSTSRSFRSLAAGVVATLVVGTILYLSQCSLEKVVRTDAGLVMVRHEKIMHQLDNVNSYMSTLQKEINDLRSDLQRSVDGKDAPKPSRKVMRFTMIFGETAVNEPWLPLFIKSAAASGADFTVIGDPALPFELPPNVKQIHISYPALVEMISKELFDGRHLYMRDAELYKVIDVKPLLGYLFRDQLTDYGFWGHIDNDMLIGNVANFLTADVLDNNDIITGIPKGMNGKDELTTWGPLTVYRNTPKITQLFRHCPDLYHVFNNHSAMFFDEWGGSERAYEDYSMTSIINKHAKALNIRWIGGFPLGWDGGCVDKPDARCSECILSERFYSEGRTRSTLTWNRTVINPDEQYKVYEVLMCHFQMGKKLMHAQFAAMTDDAKRALTSANPLFLGYREGFHI